MLKEGDNGGVCVCVNGSLDAQQTKIADEPVKDPEVMESVFNVRPCHAEGR